MSHLPRIYYLIPLLLSLLLSACATTAVQNESPDYISRAHTLKQDRVRVTATVLSPRESQTVFNTALASKKVQPIWLQIENKEDKEMYLMLLSIDPEYFSPSEVAWMFRHQEDSNFNEQLDLFIDNHIPVIIPPRSTVSGFVYTNLDPGGKAFAVELFGENEVHTFEFAQSIPGFDADFMRVDFDRLYPENEIQDLDLVGLRQYLESLPCCVLGNDKKTPGDPLNLVIVGDGNHVLATLVRQGWDLTETMRSDTAWKTVVSSLFGSQYRTSPVSPLYFFDRPHDSALQKARRTVNERNHLRLWLAPVRLKGQEVWVGQISRDIGVKLTSKTIVTHKIDPVVDEARLYITLDLLASESLKSIGYVKGVGYSDIESPRVNYTNDPYITDGYRVVLILGTERVPLDQVEFLPWEQPRGVKTNAMHGNFNSNEDLSR